LRRACPELAEGVLSLRKVDEHRARDEKEQDMEELAELRRSPQELQALLAANAKPVPLKRLSFTVAPAARATARVRARLLH
jgi:aminoglycoside phosphotransferase family enzyme